MPDHEQHQAGTWSEGEQLPCCLSPTTGLVRSTSWGGQLYAGWVGGTASSIRTQLLACSLPSFVAHLLLSSFKPYWAIRILPEEKLQILN